ncbi:hypothetical protein OPQ81_005385 [Rhizoctonia solani]|nr:hypothetical protein OPQ81_005385 [Rhizoctonia solani]
MPSSQASKRASKPSLTSTRATCSTSQPNIANKEPLVALQSPKDSTLPVKLPLSASTTKDFLCQASLLDSKSETSTMALCSNLLASIANWQDVLQQACTLICCMNLILPEAFTIISSTNTQLCAISDKIDALLSNADKEPTTPSPPVFAEIGDRLKKVMQDIQKAMEVWKMTGLTHAEIVKNRCIQSQGCYILIEPTSNAIKESLASLNMCTLTTKAELAWNMSWDAIKDSKVATSLKLSKKPRVTFKSLLWLARGGIRYELGDHTQAALLSNTWIAAEFKKGFGGGSCKGQGATILLQCALTYYNPEDAGAIQRFEEENELNKGNMLLMTWCKLPHKCKLGQTMAILRLEMRSHDLADQLITKEGQLECSPVLFRKANQEPMWCLQCQKFGHKTTKCVNGPGDICSQCWQGPQNH